MRIISGSLKGRRLKSFNATHIRPTTDRIKESIFNKWAFDIEGSRILDLFSGTGNLSFEAYSRSAAYVEAVEISQDSINIIKENIKHLEISNGIKVVKSDVATYLKKYKGKPFDLIFIDPPFTKKMAHEVMSVISNSGVWHNETKFVIESSKQERIEDSYQNVVLHEKKSYGDKAVSFFKIKDENKESEK